MGIKDLLVMKELINKILKLKTFLELDELILNAIFDDFIYDEILYTIKTYNDPISYIINKYDLKEVREIDFVDASYLRSNNVFKSIFCKWLIDILLKK